MSINPQVDQKGNDFFVKMRKVLFLAENNELWQEQQESTRFFFLPPLSLLLLLRLLERLKTDFCFVFVFFSCHGKCYV